MTSDEKLVHLIAFGMKSLPVGVGTFYARTDMREIITRVAKNHGIDLEKFNPITGHKFLNVYITNELAQHICRTIVEKMQSDPR